MSMLVVSGGKKWKRQWETSIRRVIEADRVSVSVGERCEITQIIEIKSEGTNEEGRVGE